MTSVSIFVEEAYLDGIMCSSIENEISQVIERGAGMVSGMPHIANVDGSYHGGIDLWAGGKFLGVSQMRGSKLCIGKSCPRPHYHARTYEYDYYFASWLGKRVARLMIEKKLFVFCLVGKRDFLTRSKSNINPCWISRTGPGDCFQRELISSFYYQISKKFFKGKKKKYACFEDHYAAAPSIEVIKLGPHNPDAPACVTFINTLPAGPDREKREAVEEMAIAYGESLLAEKLEKMPII